MRIARLKRPSSDGCSIHTKLMQAQRFRSGKGVRRWRFGSQHLPPQGVHRFGNDPPLISPGFPRRPFLLMSTGACLQVVPVQLANASLANLQLTGYLVDTEFQNAEFRHHMPDVSGTMTAHQLHVVFFIHLPYSGRRPDGNFGARRGSFGARMESSAHARKL